MKTMIKTLLQRFLNREYDLRVRLFHFLAVIGFVMSFVTIIFSIYTSMWANAVVGGCMVLLSVGALIYTRRTGRYKIAYSLSIGIGFLILFPIMFFTSGGYRSGVTTLFVFAVLLTVLMLEGKLAVLMSAIEVIEYSLVCAIGYYHPELVTSFETEFEIMTDVIFNGSMVSFASCIILFLHIREYNLQREELRIQNEKLKRYDEAKSTFLTTVAHEIKNPLNSISLHARDTFELLDEDPLEIELMKENMKVIENVVIRIDRIVVDLMDTVAIEQGRLALNLVPMKVSSLLKEICEIYSGKNNMKGNQLILEIDENLPLISADYARLMQVMTNLLSNSLKYTKNGKIIVSLSKEENGQLISVADNGEGMSEEMKSRALEGYVSASKEYWRHGIGLFVSHQIIEAHGGKIWIESKQGEGTRVSFILPEEEE